MAMTYTSLIQQLRATLGVSSSIIEASLPDFIERAQQNILRDAVTLELTKWADPVLELDEDNPRIPKPEDWKRPISCSFNYKNTIINLDWRTYNFMQNYDSGTGALEGASRPLFWGDEDIKTLYFSPRSSDKIELKVQYYASPATLSQDNPTNIITEKLPNALFYGSLKEAMPFLKDDARIAIWEAAYDKALQGIMKTNSLNRQDKSSNVEVD